VVNNEHKMLAVGWRDNKAVYFISMADINATDTVGRRVKDKKVDISAPVVTQIYGEEWIAMITTTFSLGKRHSLNKCNYVTHDSPMHGSTTI
jgi:hypothetical protein